MRIVAQGKVPDSFKGKPIPEQVRGMVSALDSKHGMSHGEAEWILEWTDDDFGFTTGHDISAVRWDRVAARFDKILAWARETGKSLLRHSLEAAATESDNHFVGKALAAVFGEKPWAISWLRDKPNRVKQGMMDFEREIQGGLSEDEFRWIVAKAPNQEQFSSDHPHYRSEFAELVRWSRATKTPLSTVNDIGTAKVMAREWADYAKKLEASKRLSTRGERSVALSGKWRAVWIDPQSRAKPDPREIGRQPGGRDFDYEWEVVQEITGMGMRNSDRLISIRDPQGVPQAAIEIGEARSDGRGTEVHDCDGTTQGMPKVKELALKLRQRGEPLWWIGDSYEVESIRDLEEHAQDPNGFVPSLSVDWHEETTERDPNTGRRSTRTSRRTFVVDDADGYKAALEWTYDQANQGSHYYSSTANSGIDAWADYAEQRGELHLFEEGRQSFEEWASDAWFQAEDDIVANNDDIPRRPCEDDDEFNQGGVFDQAAYSRAEAAYHAAIEPYERDFEPNQFAQRAY